MSLLELNNDVLDLIGNYVKKDNEERLRDESIVESFVYQYQLSFEYKLKEYKRFNEPVDIYLEITKILVDLQIYFERDRGVKNVEEYLYLFIDMYKMVIDKTTKKFRRNILGFRTHNEKFNYDYNFHRSKYLSDDTDEY